MKKLTKKELKDRLEVLLGTVMCDQESSERAFIDNDVYDPVSDVFIELNSSGRALLLDKIRNEKHLVREIVKILNEI